MPAVKKKTAFTSPIGSRYVTRLSAVSGKGGKIVMEEREFRIVPLIGFGLPELAFPDVTEMDSVRRVYEPVCLRIKSSWTASTPLEGGSTA